MKISWLGLLRTGPALKTAVEKMTGTPGALSSDQNWYNLIKAIVALLTVCGVAAAGTLTNADLVNISGVAAVGVPAVLTLLDGIAQIWLKTRKPDAKEMLAKRAEEKEAGKEGG